MLSLLIQHKGDAEPLILSFDDLDSVVLTSTMPGGPQVLRSYLIEQRGDPEVEHGFRVSAFGRLIQIDLVNLISIQPTSLQEDSPLIKDSRYIHNAMQIEVS